MSNWLRLLSDGLSVLGVESEWQGQELHLLAPPPLGDGELQAFWTGEPQQCPDGLSPVYPGHALLDNLQQALKGMGQCRARHLPLPRTRKSDLPQLARKAFACRNADLIVEAPAVEVTPWCFFHFRVTYEWDERRVELRSLGIDSQHLSRLEPQCLAGVWLENGPAGGERRTVPLAYQAAQRHLNRQIQPRLQSLRREADRYQQAERGRLERYYRTILADLDRREGSAEKKARFEQERELRRRELEERVRLKVSARLAQVELVDLPREHMRAVLRQRKQERALVLTYNPARHNFDPLPCQGCEELTRNLWLCDHGHIVCDACHGHCRDCRAPQCAACLGRERQSVCESCQVSGPQAATPPAPQAPPRSSKPARQPARPTPRTGLLRGVFADLMYYQDLPQILERLEKPLQRNDFAGCERLLREFQRDLAPNCQPVRDRVRACLEAFKQGRGDKIREHLEKLNRAPAPAPPRPAAAAAPRPGQLDGPTREWLRGPLKDMAEAPALERLLARVESDLSRLTRLRQVWPLKGLGLALIYLHTRLTQRDISELYRVRLSDVGKICRAVKQELEAVAR